MEKDNRQKGPIKHVVAAMTSVAKWKRDFYQNTDIPCRQQTWFIGQQICDNDDAILEEYGAKEGVTMHLLIEDEPEGVKYFVNLLN